MLITLAGESMEMLPQRALYWPAQHMLIVADIHFGKAAAFRAKGVPVPRGTTTQNLQQLEQLMQQRKIDHILFLGDFLHAKASHAIATLNAMRIWRQKFPTLELTLVRGNHDQHAGDPPIDLNMHLVDEPHHVKPFAFCHHPDLSSSAYVLAGHVHPVYRLTAGVDSLRLPCFVFSEKRGILPSFGAFTGGYEIRAEANERVFLAAEDAMFDLHSQIK